MVSITAGFNGPTRVAKLSKRGAAALQTSLRLERRPAQGSSRRRSNFRVRWAGRAISNAIVPNYQAVLKRGTREFLPRAPTSINSLRWTTMTIAGPLFGPIKGLSSHSIWIDKLQSPSNQPPAKDRGLRSQILRVAVRGFDLTILSPNYQLVSIYSISPLFRHCRRHSDTPDSANKDVRSVTGERVRELGNSTPPSSYK